MVISVKFYRSGQISARRNRQYFEIHCIYKNAPLGGVLQVLAIGSESPPLPITSDSNVGNYSSNFVMDPSDAELIQRHLHEQRGRIGKK